MFGELPERLSSEDTVAGFRNSSRSAFFVDGAQNGTRCNGRSPASQSLRQ